MISAVFEVFLNLQGSNEVEVFSVTTTAPNYFDGSSSWSFGNPWLSLGNTTEIESVSNWYFIVKINICL